MAFTGRCTCSPPRISEKPLKGHRLREATPTRRGGGGGGGDHKATSAPLREEGGPAAGTLSARR
ncbi:uncharacterized protein PHACADRAFT_261477 [Phanerochaete carnosa HHB-10118-sp]|uniref:Uncharacterized protein n=1 Tax=Phanerochaete carnosa (strain HHB-10118-sp) TaxID=650164 RepID=K5USG5_PHACS|nr:uncharacterized protein PHACADRAFT_261477 [Phanerochaete carnosa HHB-10118-sp]EKM52826.1 hypothetical protein PHACADRAFT_261477 [Phanerochaete carnosa HHB-10118-sp]